MAAGLFHVYTHCVWVTPTLYRDDVDRTEFLRGLAQVTVRAPWTCLAYCLMTSHYHLIVEVSDGVLPRAMHALNLPYARNFNGRYRLRGHVQFAPYGARRIVGCSDLLNRFAYVANNPVEAGLCSSPELWQWSSYAGTVGLAELASFVDPARLYACIERLGDDPRAGLRRRVENS